MHNLIKQILDWSEVWALLIPLAILIQKKTFPKWLKPVRHYVLVALFINLAINLIWKFKIAWGIPEGTFFYSNNFLYNIHSVVRLLLFSWFFILLDQLFMHRLKKLVPFLFLLFVIINFSFFENFFNYWTFSSRLLATEAAVLLFYCLQYFIFLLVEERDTPLARQPGFWVVSGLSVYVAVNFFIFLFYSILLKQNLELFAINIWNVHNIVYIILCVAIAKEFRQQHE